MSVVYIRMRHKILAESGKVIRLGDAAQIVAEPDTVAVLQRLPVYQTDEADLNFAVLDLMAIVPLIQREAGPIDIETLGPTQTIIVVKEKKKRLTLPLFLAVWILLFLGSALAIINFQQEVGMQKMHQKLYWMITGERKASPLLLQVPYALGIGLGMVLFFNHIFKKKINEEPSPLEIELFNYQQDLDRYVLLHENKESQKNLDD